MTCPCGARAHDGYAYCRRCLRPTMTPDVWPDLLGTGNGIWVEDGIARHAILGPRVSYGRGVRVHDFAYVGSRPFEFTREPDGTLEGFPRCGGVVLGNGVEVFPFANVDAGFLGDTIIGEGTKIDHYVHVGHNAEIGANVLLCAKANIGGHVQIGDGAFIGMGATILPRVRIGALATIGAGAVVVQDVSDGVTVMGNPAREQRGHPAPVDVPIGSGGDLPQDRHAWVPLPLGAI